MKDLSRILFFLLVIGVVVTAHAASKTEKRLANGAALVAAGRLHDDVEDKGALELLQFAVAMHPDCERALLLQAKISRGQDLPDVSLADGGKKYAAMVLEIARKTRSKKHRFLLYKVAELVQPENEEVLLALTKAKNKGTDTSFEALLGAVTGKKASAKKDKPANNNEPERGESRLVVRRRPHVPRVTASRKEMPKILEETKFTRNLRHSVRDALNGVRTVNEVTMPKGCLIRFDTKRYQVQRSSSGDGNPYYSGRLVWPAARLPANRHYYYDDERTDYGGVSAMDWVRLMSGVYGFAWKMDDRGIVLADPEDAEARKTTGEVVDAATLVAAMKKSRVGFLKQYRKKRILLCGVVSGVGKSMGKEFVNLADDKVRVLVSSKSNREKLDALRVLYRKNKRISRGYNQRQIFFFVMNGKCGSEAMGKIVVKGSGQFSWMGLYQDN